MGRVRRRVTQRCSASGTSTTIEDGCRPYLVELEAEVVVTPGFPLPDKSGDCDQACGVWQSTAAHVAVAGGNFFRTRDDAQRKRRRYTRCMIFQSAASPNQSSALDMDGRTLHSDHGSAACRSRVGQGSRLGENLPPGGMDRVPSRAREDPPQKYPGVKKGLKNGIKVWTVEQADRAHFQEL